MRTSSDVINDYLSDGIISKDEAEVLIEKCAAINRQTISDFLGGLFKQKSPQGAKSVAKKTAKYVDDIGFGSKKIKETLKTVSPQGAKSVAKKTAKHVDDIGSGSKKLDEALNKLRSKSKASEAPRNLGKKTLKTISPIKRATVSEKIKEYLFSPTVAKPLIATGASTLIAGGVGAGALLKHHFDLKKDIKRNYANLINTYPEMKKYDAPLVINAIKELIQLSPFAATNDNLLKDYVKKKLKKKLTAGELNTISNIKRPVMATPMTDAFRKPPFLAKSIGDIFAGYMDIPPSDRDLVLSKPEYKSTYNMLRGVMLNVPGVQSKVWNEVKNVIKKDPKALENLSIETGYTPESIIEGVNRIGTQSFEKKAGKKGSIGGLGMLLGLGALGTGVGLAHGAMSLYNQKKRDEQIRKTHALVKTLVKRDSIDGKRVDSAFSVLAKYAPALASNIETALPFVKDHALDYPEDERNSVVRVPHPTIKALAETQKMYDSNETENPLSGAFSKGFGRGFQGGVSVSKFVPDTPA